MNNRILIVEDDAYVSRMYARAFKAAGYEVDTAPDGEKALEFLRSNPAPTVILMDVMMPKMSGIDLLTRLKGDKELSKIPVAVLTNSFVKENQDLFLSHGASLYLIKIENSSKEIVEKIDGLVAKSVGFGV